MAVCKECSKFPRPTHSIFGAALGAVASGFNPVGAAIGLGAGAAIDLAKSERIKLLGKCDAEGCVEVDELEACELCHRHVCRECQNMGYVPSEPPAESYHVGRWHFDSEIESVLRDPPAASKIPDNKPGDISIGRAVKGTAKGTSKVVGKTAGVVAKGLGKVAGGIRKRIK